jgi:signal transduction histidine kinase/GAF domain-containing protein
MVGDEKPPAGAQDQELATEAPVLSCATRLNTLIEVGRRIDALRNAETLTERIVALLYERFGHDYIHLLLVDAGGESLVLQAGLWHGYPVKSGDESMCRMEDDGVVSWVASRGQAALVSDVDNDSRWQPHPAFPRAGCQMVAPLIGEEGILGVLDVESDEVDAFDEIDHLLLQTLADRVTASIEDARFHAKMANLFDETRQRLNEASTLHQLTSEITSSLHLTEVLDVVVQAIRRVMGCRGCCIFLLDSAEQVLEINAAAGLKPEWRDAARLKMGEGIAGLVAFQARPIYVADTLLDSDYVFFDPEVRSLLAVPLQVKGRVIGVINVDDRLPSAFGPHQERLLTIAAAQVAIVIDNARLFSEVLSEKQRIDAIIHHMADGLLMLDQEGTVVSCNPALATMLDIPEQDIEGQSIAGSGVDSRLQAVCGVASDSTVTDEAGIPAQRVEIPRVDPGGCPLRPRTLRVHTTAVMDEANQPLGEVRVVHDVTKEREVEEMKEEFLSIASHELRTPLFSMQGFIGLILDDQVPDVETQREFLRIAYRQTERLAALATNLLDLSRLNAGKLELQRESVQLLDVMNQATQKLLPLAHGKQITLVVDLPPDLPTITGDQTWLEHVVTNLVDNAIKFSPEGGQVAVSASQSDGEILVEVRDTGVGIPPESLDQIFEKFYRVPDETGERPEGTGLGLHIARIIVDAHGGRIWAESAPGEGSVVRFVLPCG